MLTKVLLKNFKPFGETEQSIDLGKITIFIGPNGTGKSSALQALALLSQSAGSTSLKPGKFQFSSYSELVHKGVTSKSMVLGFAGEAKYPSQNVDSFRFYCQSDFSSTAEVVSQIGVIEKIEPPDLLRDVTRIKGVYLHGDMKVEPPKIGGDEFSVSMRAGNIICSPLQMAGSSYRGEDYKKDIIRLQENLTSLFQAFSKAMRKVFIVGTLRGFEQLSYPLGNSEVEQPDTASQIVDTFAYRREVEKKVSDWLEHITGVRVSFHLVPNRMANLETPEGYNIYHEGFGTNQLIKPLLQIAIAPSDSLIAIEEAEIHLHPKAQIKLCDLLYEIAAEEEKQIVLTTHSEHILTGFLNLVAGGKLKSGDLAVYYFQKDKGEARAEKLNVDENGALEGGLKGFAEASLEELERHLKALAKKSK